MPLFMQNVLNNYPLPYSPILIIHVFQCVGTLKGLAPKSYSQEQLDELDRLTEKWVNDHYGQRRTTLK